MEYGVEIKSKFNTQQKGKFNFEQQKKFRIQLFIRQTMIREAMSINQNEIFP
jgi:hypothetical protein